MRRRYLRRCGGYLRGPCRCFHAADRAGGLPGRPDVLLRSSGFAFAHLFNPKGEQDAAGIIEEIHSRMLSEGHALPHIKPEHRLEAGYTFSYVDPDWFSITIFEMMEEAGVELLLHSLVVDVTKDGDAVTGVVVENTNGTMYTKGKVIIDCTGEGDIAIRAGAPYEYVDRDTVQPHTISFTMDGVNWDELMIGSTPIPTRWSGSSTCCPTGARSARSRPTRKP